MKPMPEGWERLTTEILRHMLREFLTHPAEFLTFKKLAFLIRTNTNFLADADLLHIVAEQRRDLFIIAGNDRCLKLFTEAVERIVKDGLEHAIDEVGPINAKTHPKAEGHRCDHFSGDEEILADLTRCSFPPSALTRNCCWREICRVRARNPKSIDKETWREICSIRGYLLERQNPRGF